MISVIEDINLWENFVDDNPFGMIYHKWAFLQIIQKYSGFKLVPYGIYKGEELVCLFPLFVKNKLGIRFAFSPPPRLSVPHMGVLLNREYSSLKQDRKESHLDMIVDEICNELKILSPTYTHISGTPYFLDIRPFKWNGFIAIPSYTYVVNLEDSLEKIWENLGRGCRKNIRKAKNLLSLEESKNPQKLYDMLNIRFGEISDRIPVQVNYFNDIINNFKDNVKIYYLYEGDSEIIGCLLISKFGDRFSLWSGNVKIAHSEGSNEYLNWELMRLAKAEGYKKFELTGANIRTLCQFKSKFNPSLEMSFDIYKKTYFGNLMEQLYRNLTKKG